MTCRRYLIAILRIFFFFLRRQKSLAPQYQSAERRHPKSDRVLPAIPRRILSRDLAFVVNARTAVTHVIRGYQLAVHRRSRNTHAIILIRIRSEIEQHEQLIPVRGAAQEGKKALISVVGIDPLKALPRRITFPQFMRGKIKMVQLGCK